MFGIPLRPKTARKVNLFFRVLIGLVAAWTLVIQVAWHHMAEAAHRLWNLAVEDYLFFLATLYVLVACIRGRWNPFRL